MITGLHLNYLNFVSGHEIHYFPLQTFRRLLISKLQDEFENRARNVDGMSLKYD